MKNILLFLFIFSSLFAQQKNNLPYQNTKLMVEERAADLVSRMTLKEKISQMNYAAPAIERLGIPAYNWWNECLHGVARNGLATVFPQAIGLAAMWDKNLMFRIAETISDEARAKYNDAISRGQHGIYQGLTFWSPNINIFRDPRWGRGMETYGEDPYLTGQTAVQFIKGLQGNDPKYFKVIATAKHFAVHSGPEPDRHSFDANVSEYDLRETYLPAFKMSVQKANVQSLMCAYNSLRGKACCSNDPLLDKILRDEWGFKGYVVSDCWAISDIYQFHKQTNDASEASALSVKAGTDLECGNSYPALNDAIQKGLIKEEEINLSLKRLMEARIRLGMFDPPENVPFSKLKFDIVDSKKNKKLAEEAAKKSIVLLKNQNNLLPLKKNIKTIAVIGPNANDEEILLGNYNGTPSDPVTPLNGINNKTKGKSKIIFERGCDIAAGIPYLEVVPEKYLYISADKKKNGLTAEYFDNSEWKGEPSLKKTDAKIDFKWLRDSKDKIFDGNKSVRWSGYISPEKSGTYQLGGYGFNGFNIYLNDSLMVKFKGEHHPNKVYKNVELKAGELYKIRIDFFASGRYSQMQMLWSVPDDNAEERAIEAVKKSDIAIMFMGLSPRLEGEELNLNVKGFKGGDRTSLDLPESQEMLIQKIVRIGKPVVLVLLNGSALSINWEDENIPAIVEAWYGGQAAGTSIADMLFGDYNPSGKLPVTFYRSVTQLPDFKDYGMSNRTYRYFKGDVLYPFGFGLSYSTYEFSDPKLNSDKFCIGDTLKLSVEVKNRGKLSGEEVVQLYVKGDASNSFAPVKSLKGFERISLKPNQKKRVEFIITSETLEEFIEKRFSVRKGEHILMVGNSSNNSDLKEIKLIVE